MAKLSIYEMRRLVLPTETVVEAVLQFDRDSGGLLWQGTILDATIESEPAPTLVLAVRSEKSGALEHRTFNVPAIAAAIIHYCRHARIPLPRDARKALEVVPEGFAFVVETSISRPRLHTGLAPSPSQPAQPANAVSQAAAASASETAS